MASELQTDYLSGFTVYFLLRNSVGQIWNGSSFVTYASVDYANYPITGTEQGTSGYYAGDMPAVALGYYGVIAKQRVGGSPAESDITVGSGNLYWSGTVASVLPLVNGSGAVYSDVIQFSGIVINNQLAQVGANVVSGQVNVNSGTAYLASGSLFRNTFASGVLGASGGLPLAWGNSGQVFSASGANVVVPASTLSGVIANSGLFVTVPPATISGVVVNSGLFVTVPTTILSGVVFASGGFVNASLNSGQVTIPYSGSMSGQVVGVVSGTRVNTWDAMDVGNAQSGSISLVQLANTAPSNSGVLVGERVEIVQGAGAGQSRTITSYSGAGRWATVFPDFYVAPDTTSVVALRGTKIQVVSGQLSGQVVTAASGVFGTASLNSGQFVNVYSGQLSGQLMNPASGAFVVVPVSTLSGVIAASGGFVTVLKENLSGIVANSGLFVTAPISAVSGIFVVASLNSGQFTLPYSGQLSGQRINADVRWISGANVDNLVAQVGTNVVSVNSGQLSGQVVSIHSGTLFPASGSTQIASGAFTVVLKETLSGVIANSGLSVIAPISTLSGITVASGLFTNASLNSGQSVLVYSGQLSGQQVTSRTVLDKSGYVLATDGLDLISVESGMNMRQAQAVIAAANGGQLSGVGTGTIRIAAANVSGGPIRITGVVSSGGNRDTVALNLPS